MSKRDKLRRKLQNNPKQAKKQDILTLLTAFGFVLDRVSGSHHMFIYRSGDVVQRLVIPIHRNVVKPKYVRWAMEVLDAVFPLDLEENENGDDDDSQDA